MWIFGLLCFTIVGSLAEEERHLAGPGGHVWIEGLGASEGLVHVGNISVIRWGHFVGSSRYYTWMFLYHPEEDEFAGNLVGHTEATGTYDWEVRPSLCGKFYRVRVCSGDPPRTSKHACHQSAPFEVKGNCRPPKKRLHEKAIESAPQEGSSGSSASTTTPILRHKLDGPSRPASAPDRHLQTAAAEALARAGSHLVQQSPATVIRPTVVELGPLPLESRRKTLHVNADDEYVVERPNTSRDAMPRIDTVALVVLWLGTLPSYYKEFAATAQHAGPTFFVFYTGDGPEPPSTSRVRFRRITRQDIASRMWKVAGLRRYLPSSFERTLHLIEEAIADDNGPKGNDYKILYGALFKDELEDFTHWGWTDLDVYWGSLGNFLTQDLLSTYDIVTAPDGEVPALYFSGQLTIFRNQPKFSTLFLGCLQDRQRDFLRYGGCMAEAFIDEAQMWWDEKIAIWYAALHGARIWIDFSVNLVVSTWLKLGHGALFRADGRLLLEVKLDRLPHVDVERLNMGLHQLQNVSTCYGEFGNWSFVCISNVDVMPNSALGSAYMVRPDGVTARPAPLHLLSTGSVEFGFLHLHRNKEDSMVSESAIRTGVWECHTRTMAKRWSVTCDVSTLCEGIAHQHRIPNIVHFVLTDRDTRFFDWTCFVAVKSAWEKLRPIELIVHVLDGIEPTTADGWWRAAKRYITRVLPFDRSAVPLELNGVLLRHPAMIGDFYRMQVLYDWGGIYMDTDAISLRSFDELRWHRAVFGRQGGKRLRPAVGLMMFEPRSSIAAGLVAKMKATYTGVWAIHSVHALDDALEAEPPPGAAILSHSGGFFASSWDLGDFMDLVEDSGRVDWTLAWSMHLYHSQTGKFTHDPRDVCGTKDRRASDLCQGFANATELSSVMHMVSAGLPIWNSKLEKEFSENQKRQIEDHAHPVVRNLDVVHASSSKTKTEL